MGTGGPNTWELVDVWNSDKIDSETQLTKEERVEPSNQQANEIDSEEEETVVLKPQFGGASKSELEEGELERNSKSPAGMMDTVEGATNNAGQEGSTGRKRRPRRGKRGSKQDSVVSSETSQTRKASDAGTQPVSTTSKTRKRRQKK